MKLSVVMSTYNNKGTITHSVESVLNQSFGDFEFIIINDGSTDETARILKGYEAKDERIVLINQENLGLTKSLNIGIRIAKAEYIARQDADDISFPERFASQLDFLERNKETGFAGCDCEIIDEFGEFLNFVRIENDAGKNIRRLKERNIFCHGSMMFRAESLRASFGYRAFFKYAQDYDLYLRLIEFTLPGSVNKFLYQKRINLDSISIQKVSLQNAYARLAKKCFERRVLGLDDAGLLQDSMLTGLAEASPYDFVLPFMKALRLIKLGEVVAGRKTIQPFLSPVSVRKSRLYGLFIFSYAPAFLRNALFAVKKRLRKIRMAVKPA